MKPPTRPYAHSAICAPSAFVHLRTKQGTDWAISKLVWRFRFLGPVVLWWQWCVHSPLRARLGAGGGTMDVAAWLRERRGGGAGYALPDPIVHALAVLYEEGEWSVTDVVTSEEEKAEKSPIWQAIFDEASKKATAASSDAALSAVGRARCLACCRLAQ